MIPTESKPLTKKVKRVRFHVGVQVGQAVVTSLDCIKNSVTMEMTPVGVLIVSAGKEPLKEIVPFGNIHSITLDAQ